MFTPRNRGCLCCCVVLEIKSPGSSARIYFPFHCLAASPWPVGGRPQLGEGRGWERRPGTGKQKTEEKALGEIIHTFVFSITTHRCWTVKRANGEKMDSFGIRCWRNALQIPWTARKTDKWDLEQRKPQMPTLKLSSYFEHTTRQQGPLEKTVMQGKWKAAGKEGAHG